MKNSYFFQLSLMMALNYPVHSQNSLTISGAVSDFTTKESLPFTHIIIKEAEIGFTTDENGEFLFTLNNVNLLDSIAFSHIGYSNHYEMVGKMINTPLSIELKQHLIVLSMVTIEATKESTFDLKLYMEEVVEHYNLKRSKNPYIARAYFSEKSKMNDKYVFFNEGLGYSIFMGKYDNWSALALFKFYCENTRVSNPLDNWLNLTKSEVGIGGGTNLNFFSHFETEGFLSIDKVSKYKYQLDSVFLDNGRLVNVIAFKKGNESGKIIVQDDFKIRKIEFYGSKRLWSNVLQKRVNASGSISFNYFNGTPFVSNIHTYHENPQFKYWNTYKVMAQKLNEFDIDADEIAALNNYDRNPIITYNSDEWLHEMGNNGGVKIQDMEMATNHISIEDQFKSNSGKPYIESEPNKSSKTAQNFIKKLKMLF